MLPVWAEKLSQNRGSPNKLWQSPLGQDQRPQLKRKKGVNPGVTETTGDPEAILGNIPGDIPSSSHSCQQASTSMGLPVHEPLSSIPGHQPLSIRYIKDLVPSEFPCWLIIMSDKKLKKISTFRCLNLIKQFSKIYGRHVNYQYCFLLSLWLRPRVIILKQMYHYLISSFHFLFKKFFYLVEKIDKCVGIWNL